jgi:hypothetical protein
MMRAGGADIRRRSPRHARDRHDGAWRTMSVQRRCIGPQRRTADSRGGPLHVAQCRACFLLTYSVGKLAVFLRPTS